MSLSFSEDYLYNLSQIFCFFRNFRTLDVIHQRNAVQGQLVMTFSIGKLLLWDRRNRHIRAECSSWQSTFQQTIRLSRQKWRLRLVYIIQISTAMEASAWTFWDLNGLQLWLSQKVLIFIFWVAIFVWSF